MYRLIDSHAHLDELEDLESSLEKARRAGIIAVVAVGSDLQSNQEVLRIPERCSLPVYPALGLHPWGLGGIEAAGIDEVIGFIERNIRRITGIGEIGLDYDKRVIKTASKELQKSVFQRLLELARRYKKPAIIHSRYAWKDSFELARGMGVSRAIFHWYTGPSSVLRDIIGEGYFVSATPATEYHSEHRRAVREAPLERLLLETDCPVLYGREMKYMSEPADVARSLKAVAALKGIDEATAARRTTENAINFFDLDERVLTSSYSQQA